MIIETICIEKHCDFSSECSRHIDNTDGLIDPAWILDTDLCSNFQGLLYTDELHRRLNGRD